MTTLTATEKKERTLFGHPIGLSYLFTTEMAERFSYYGMTAILVYYLTGDLLLRGHVEHVIGYGAVASLLSGLGAHTTQQVASNIFGLYTGLVYATPWIGGLFADRVLGQRYTVVIGGALMALGEFMLMSDALFFLGLLCLIVGNGAFKPNISTQVGNLYKPGDARIDRAYSIFYVGINIGATLSPLICGTLGEEMCTDWTWSHGVCAALGQSAGWHFGFFAAGVGVTLGLLVYLYALRTLPPDRIARAKAGTEKSAGLTGNDWRAIWSIVALCVPTALFWMAYQQQGNTIALWAQQHTDRTLIPGLINAQIPFTWFQSFNPALIFLFTPLVIALWSRQAKAKREPTVVAKMTIGCFLLAAAYLVMAIAAYVTGPTAMASWLWLLLFFVVFTTGELYLSPIGLSLVARVAPPQILSMMMGFWFITSFVGNSFSGYIGGYFNVLSKTNFFLLTAAIPAVAGLIMWLLERPLRPVLESRNAAPNLQHAEAAAE